MKIDTHAHIFTPHLPFQQQRRYTPSYEASLTNYLAELDQHDVSHGVLIQPSFLGLDNSFLLNALNYTSRLRGVVCVDPLISFKELQKLNQANVVGVRLNLIGQTLPDLTSNIWKQFLRFIQELDWHIEIHCFSQYLDQLLPPLIDQQIKVVIDHFGRPTNYKVSQDSGFLYMLQAAKSGLIWCKLSAIYRNIKTPDQEKVFISEAMPLLLEHLTPTRLMWGSDWPHTQYESPTNYALVNAQINQWLPETTIRKTILWDTPAQLFRFNH